MEIRIGVGRYFPVRLDFHGGRRSVETDQNKPVGQRHYPWLPVRCLLNHPFDALSRAAAIRTPMLCLVAGSDRIIPPAHAARLCAAWGGPKRWVEFPGADHNDIAAEPGYWPAIADFLASLPR